MIARSAVLAGLAAVLLSPGAATAQAAAPVAALAWERDAFGRQALQARLWVEDERDVFQRGDRLRLRIRTSHDAYVAVVHVDTDGRVELLFPEGLWDAEFVRGGRTYALPRGGWDSFITVRERPGIGFFHLIASAEPLNLNALRRAAVADRGFVGIGGAIRGDPFWVLDRITRVVVADPRFSTYTTDTYGYQVGGRHRYPAYACTDAYGRDFWDGVAYYGSCERIVRLLSAEPYYYDTRRYRGDRRVYLHDRDPGVRHGYKEPADRAPAVSTPRVERPGASAPSARPSSGGTSRPADRRPAPREEARPAAERPEPRPAAERPAVERPRLERRPAEREPAARPDPPAEGRGEARPAPPPERREEPRRPAPAREEREPPTNDS